MITDSDLREIFSNAPVSKTYIEVITLKADWFSQTYHLQNQVSETIQVTLEDDSVVDVDYVPMSIAQASNNNDLNHERTIVIQEVNDIIAAEVANYDPTTDELPVIESRGYVIYRDGTISSLKTPVTSLPISELTRNEKGTSIVANTKKTDDQSTGEIATIARVPMYKGYQ